MMVRALPSRPHHKQDSLSPNTITLRVEIPTQEFSRDTNIQSIAVFLLITGSKTPNRSTLRPMFSGSFRENNQMPFKSLDKIQSRSF
jgi:hypothetical protein